ncbi:SGNH/GDSL hydrolase family protein [Polaribacter sp. L3A8]|uniref:SGNH/GDSL hydrolase family protein n=1 Tax=Polaribacter sp. L3A8 TaxID=2686361 RepID=UPI00131BAC9C|nr:SGNH/GDSL hydrolase family protein [Polaribacter sp. L3A8]
MKNKILFFIAFIICGYGTVFSQNTILNNFETDSPSVVAKNDAKFAIVKNPSLTKNNSIILNDFEPNSPNVVARSGASILNVPNPNSSEQNNTANCIRIGRTTNNWFELIAFPVANEAIIPANTIKYITMAVNYPAEPDIAIRIDGDDENSNGSATVAIRPINKYTNFGNWQTLTFKINGGQNGAQIKAIVIFPDAGFENSPIKKILNNTDSFGYIDEIKLNDTDSEETTYKDYLTNVKLELVKNWPANRTINLVFHGHSVPSGYNQTPIVNTLNSYPHQVLQKLSAKYPTAVINTIKTSIGGENSIQGARRFDEDVLVYKPDVLFIDYSLNDRSQGLEATYAAWDEMIKKAVAKGIKVILLTPSPFRDVDMLSTTTELYQHTEQVKRLAIENGVALVDSYEQFKKAVVAGNNVNNYLSSFNHPNAAGHTLISDEIIKFF